MKRGVFYIAFGKNFIKEVILSAESVKQNCGDIHITLFSDKEVESEFIDDCKVIDVQHIRPKVDYISESPYEQTIFLDSDTIVDHDITEMFDLLDKYEFAICHDLARKRENVSKLIPEYNEVPYAFSEVNPGVMVFSKTDNVMNFFENWKKLFYKYISSWPYEQPTFRTALWQSDVNFYIMPPEFNVRDDRVREKAVRMHHEFGEDHLKARIYHMHVDRRINAGTFEVDSLEDALEFCKENLLRYS